MPIPRFVEVILPLALPKLYTYSVPEPLAHELREGARVVVQLGRRKLYTAIVHRLHSQPPQEYITKDILQVLDPEPIVVPGQLQLWEWMAGYYMCTLGEVMRAALPSGLRLASETRVTLAPGAERLQGLSALEAQLVRLIGQGRDVPIGRVVGPHSPATALGVLRALVERRVLSVQERMEPGYKPKREFFVRLHPRVKRQEDVQALLSGLGRAGAQQRLLMAFLTLTAAGQARFSQWVPRRALMDKAQAAPAALSALVAKEVFELQEREVSRVSDAGPLNSADLTLTPPQQQALLGIQQAHLGKGVVLLHGVTASGKTELYIQLIAQQLEQGKQVLYLLPEIALTAQIISRLKRFFGGRVGVYHSKFSDSQRLEVYQGLWADGANPNTPSFDVILGVRSSIFLPFRRLGLVIVDEEHESTYKQHSPQPRYHARDSAIVLAQRLGARVLLGTATPSVETYHNALAGKYALVELTQRYGDAVMPRVEVADTLRARRRKQMRSMFTPTLLEAMGQALEARQQVILFQNRRGYAPFVECQDCAWIPGCKHCAVTLTYHLRTDRLACHYCGYSTQPPKGCSACGGHRMASKGFGTERVEDDLAAIFPAAAIARLDLDTARSRAAYERLIAEFERGAIDILIGTQMVTKGLDFDRVSLVGILNADNMLFFPDFRAHERSFQLMTQVSGRAGRRDTPGRVIIQTAHPQDPIVAQVVAGGYQAFFQAQAQERERLLYPPFCRLVRLSVRHRAQAVAHAAAQQLAQALRGRLGPRVLGPEPPVVSRIQNYYIEDLLIKLEPGTAIGPAKGLMAEAIGRLKGHRAYASVIVAPDVDPQ